MASFLGPVVHLSPLRKHFAPLSWKNATRSPKRPKLEATRSTSLKRLDPSMIAYKQHEWNSNGLV